MHITTLMDVMARGHSQGKFVYLASVDVEAAFDTVPHKRILETLREWGTHDYLLRYIHIWLRG